MSVAYCVDVRVDVTAWYVHVAIYVTVGVYASHGIQKEGRS